MATKSDWFRAATSASGDGPLHGYPGIPPTCAPILTPGASPAGSRAYHTSSGEPHSMKVGILGPSGTRGAKYDTVCRIGVRAMGAGASRARIGPAHEPAVTTATRASTSSP